MARRLQPVACVISLLLCAAVAALWIVTHWRSDALFIEQRRGANDTAPRGLVSVGLTRGVLVLLRPRDGSMSAGDAPLKRGQTFRIRHWSEPRDSSSIAWWGPYAGFWYSPTLGLKEVSFPCDVLVVPLYAILLAFAVAPLLWLRRRLARHHRATRGKCLACGYDLTGNASGTCPECGRPIPAEVVP